MLENLLYRVLLMAFLADGIIVVLSKLGVIEWVQVHAPEILVKLSRCRYCMGFWLTLLMSIVGFMFVPDWGWLIVPLAAAAIVRQL